MPSASRADLKKSLVVSGFPNAKAVKLPNKLFTNIAVRHRHGLSLVFSLSFCQRLTPFLAVLQKRNIALPVMLNAFLQAIGAGLAVRARKHAHFACRAHARRAHGCTDRTVGRATPRVRRLRGGAWSGTPIRDTSCCCYPLTGAPYLRIGPRRHRPWRPRPRPRR